MPELYAKMDEVHGKVELELSQFRMTTPHHFNQQDMRGTTQTHSAYVNRQTRELNRALGYLTLPGLCAILLSSRCPSYSHRKI
eukprot:5510950-Amphidinium_carterae.1